MQDVPEAVRCCNEEQIRRFIPPLPIPYTEDDAIAFIGAAQQRLDQGSVTLVIGEGGDAALCGSIGLRTIAPGIAQTGYWVAPEARGRGLAGTALVLVSRWALAALPLIRLQLFVDVDNPASMRVAERAGFNQRARCATGMTCAASGATPSCSRCCRVIFRERGSRPAAGR